jgi:uncharacterized protein YbjT (DUF2867 family)
VQVVLDSKYKKLNMETAAVIGATGLIGSHILNELINDLTFSEIRLLVRRPFEVADIRVKIIQLDFTDIKAFRAALQGCEHVFCSIGTTRAKTPDLKVYRKIDFDIPVTAAQLCAENGVAGFHLVSAVGANSRSRNFYSQIKGEVEDVISALNIPQIGIYRPSLLLGNRKEVRIAETISARIMPVFSFLIPSVYKPVKASQVAKAMVRHARNATAGLRIYHYADMH